MARQATKVGVARNGIPDEVHGRRPSTQRQRQGGNGRAATAGRQRQGGNGRAATAGRQR
ncbi:hypothetical protein ACVWY0_004304, partial [Arthrobacter sp. UYNi723]